METKKRKREKSEQIGRAHLEPLEASLCELAQECLIPACYGTHWVPHVRFTQMGRPVLMRFASLVNILFLYYSCFLDILIF
jgi:hypothetical protein